MYSQQHPSGSPPVDESGRLTAAKAPVSGVSVPRHMGVGSDLVHTLDYVVLLQVMFNLASSMESTPLSVWKQLQERGIRSAKNARELVGRNAVYESFARLLDAGYVRRTQLPHPTKPGRKGPVVYEVYDNPAWNPDWSPASPETEGNGEAKPQVMTLPGTPEASFGEADKTAGQNASRRSERFPGSGKRNRLPPTPPGGGGFLLPYPSHPSLGFASVTEGGGAGILSGGDLCG